jgi:hypothetical protein
LNEEIGSGSFPGCPLSRTRMGACRRRYHPFQRFHRSSLYCFHIKRCGLRIGVIAAPSPEV